jgi:hypothetical protein
VDPGRDRVLIVSDETASGHIGRDLHQVVDRLRNLPSAVPIDEAARNEDERRALKLVRQHLGRAWDTRYGMAMSEADLRTVCRSLGVQVLDLPDGGSHRTAAEQLLRGLLPPESNVSKVWELLVRQGHQLAEGQTFLDRAELVRILKNKGIVLSPVARLRPDIQRLRDRTKTNIDLLGNDRFIVAPEGAVEVDRSAMAALATADGNIAITGGSGAGKSTELYRLVVGLRQRGADVVVLRHDNLRRTSGQTRQELNLDNDLVDVLVGWHGRARQFWCSMGSTRPAVKTRRNGSPLLLTDWSELAGVSWHRYVSVAPTSTRAHPYVFRPEVTVRGVTTRLMLDQLRAVDREKAIGDRVGRLSPQESVEVNRLLRAVLDIL